MERGENEGNRTGAANEFRRMKSLSQLDLISAVECATRHVPDVAGMADL